MNRGQLMGEDISGGWLGIDVGGANLKLADGAGFARSQSFALWKQPEGLVAALNALLSTAAAESQQLAVTMTGELCDCYRTKAEGVRAILDAVVSAAAGRRVCVYLCDGRLVDPADARERSQLAAASNWHALATYCCRFVGETPGLLIDIGSTTTDMVPLGPDGLHSTCRTDYERLLQSELVYTGVQRTPLAALIDALPYRGDFCMVASELFAMTGDAYVLTGDLEEDPNDADTADGRPQTVEFAAERMARMLCQDRTTFSLEDARGAARAVREIQLNEMVGAASSVMQTMQRAPQTVVFSGAGEFLAQELLQKLGLKAEVVSLAHRLGPEASRCAPAYALAVLAAENEAKGSA